VREKIIPFIPEDYFFQFSEQKLYLAFVTIQLYFLFFTRLLLSTAFPVTGIQMFLELFTSVTQMT
jgi:hypothetical protein